MTVGPGAVLSHYRLVEKIGEGGMGVVYRAEDMKLRRQVALKVLPPELVANEERRLRFLREARTAAAVNHPNIATVHEIDEADGVVFITMELVEGKTLRKQMGGKALPIKDTLRIATEMAEGLAEAHKAHVIHRDLKPDNVIVAHSGHSKILDFGLAKLHEDLDEVRRSELSKLDTVSGEMTREGKVMGTPAYMSPEQARGKPVDARSDLFAFGITLYEMVTGTVPFKGKTATDTLSAIIRDAPLPSGEINSEVPQEMERIIGKCLEKDPAERYQHTDELAVDLRHLKRTTDSGVQRFQTPSGPSAIPRGPRWTRRVLIAAFAALLVTGAVVTWKAFLTDKHFQAGHKIVVADFENRTGRPELGASIRDAVERMLVESRFIEVVRGTRLEDILKQHNNVGSSRIDRETVEQICRGGDCDGFIIGLIEQDKQGYGVTVEVYLSGQTNPRVTDSTSIVQEEDLLIAIHEMVIDVRHSLGESPDQLSGNCPPTTSSLAAYQTWAKATRSESPDDAARLVREALEIDPEFILAYGSLGSALWNNGDYGGSREAFEQAYRRRSPLPKRCQLYLEYVYLWSIHDYDAAFDSMKTYAQLYPSDYKGPHALSLLYTVAYDDLQDYVSYCRDAYRLAPMYRSVQQNLSFGLQYLGDADEIDQLAHDLQQIHIPDSWIDYHRQLAAMLRGEEAKIRQIVERRRHASLLDRVSSNFQFLSWLLASGRFAEATRELPAAVRATNELRNRKNLFLIEPTQAWLAKRRGEIWPIASDMAREILRESFPELHRFASFSVDMGADEPLGQLIREHQHGGVDTGLRYIRDTLQFANGCMALIRKDFQTAREEIEPLARKSGLISPQRMLGRAYEGLGLLRQAADRYEEVLRNPYLKWDTESSFPHPAIQVLEQFRLAQVYEKLGDTDRARHWYERFTEDWKNADSDIPELIEARERLAELNGESGPTENAGE